MIKTMTIQDTIIRILSTANDPTPCQIIQQL